MRSKVRFSTLQRSLYVHSAYPTMDSDAVFFGPDTYRFTALIQRTLKPCHAHAHSILDIGCGTGAGGIIAAQTLDPTPSKVIFTDINPRFTASRRVAILKLFSLLAAVLLILGALAGCSLTGLIVPNSTLSDKPSKKFGKPPETLPIASGASGRHRTLALRPGQRAVGVQQGTVANGRAPVQGKTVQNQRGPGARTNGQAQPNPESAGGTGRPVTCQPVAGATPFFCRPDGKGGAVSMGTVSDFNANDGDSGVVRARTSSCMASAPLDGGKVR